MKYKHQLFYYRYEVWSEMVEQNIESLTTSVFEKIPQSEFLNNKKLGYSKLKFIPKNDKGNLRPIVNMKLLTHKTVSCFFILFNTLYLLI
jgi:hypothetical protein